MLGTICSRAWACPTTRLERSPISSSVRMFCIGFRPVSASTGSLTSNLPHGTSTVARAPRSLRRLRPTQVDFSGADRPSPIQNIGKLLIEHKPAGRKELGPRHLRRREPGSHMVVSKAASKVTSEAPLQQIPTIALIRTGCIRRCGTSRSPPRKRVGRHRIPGNCRGNSPDSHHPKRSRPEHPTSPTGANPDR